MKDCIELIIDNALTNPLNPCILESSYQLTYDQFINDVRKVATYLKQNNYQKVLLNLNQGREAYAVTVASLLVGGYFCPLNLDSPEDRKLYVARQFNPDIIITQQDLQLPASKIDEYPQITVAEIFLNTKSELPIKELLNKTPHEYSYVIYTSGSTGSPKGVIIKRSGLNKFLEWSLQNFRCVPQDRWGQYSSLSFDLSIVDIFTALCSGCALVPLSDKGQKIRPAKTIAKHQISIWHSVPGVVDFLIKSESQKPADLSSLRVMSFCGEPLYEYQLAYLFSKNPNLTIFNTYGPTEGTLFCTWVELNKSNFTQFTNTSVSIGKAIPGWNLFLEDLENDDKVKQLTIYGDYLGKGYLNLDSNAFSVRTINGKEEYCYDSGDLVRELNSNLYFVGRKDNQIKIRGYRIELDEIDAWIMKYTGAKSVSISHNDLIHSFIEIEKVDETGLRSFLETHIENYKVPAYFHVIGSFPRNSNQKINRIELKSIADAKGKTDISI